MSKNKNQGPNRPGSLTLKKPAQNKIKVLAYCDTPSCATGFGTVSRNIFEGLYSTGRYAIDVLGINYWGNPHPFPYRIWPTGTNPQNDPYGRQKICKMIPQMEFDLLFFLQDSFIMDFLPELIPQLRLGGKKFKSICYYPIDGVPKEQWIKNISAVDFPVSYCEYGKRLSQEVYPSVTELGMIPHGVNIREYYPLAEQEIKEFRQKYFASQANKFVWTNLNRNQQRKDIPRTIMAFSEFKKIVPDSVLYLHMAKQDQGWDLLEVCKSFGLNIRTDVIFPENFGPNQGYPRDVVNLIYNVSDCVVSSCLGEGFGLSWIEAMAAKTPILMPNNTALTEFITEDRGYLIDSGTNPSLYTVLGHDNEVIRPLVDVDDMVKKMLHIYKNYDEAKQKAENAYKWVTTSMDWQRSIVPQWIPVFDNAYKSLLIDLNAPAKIEKDRNETIDAEEF
jgi:glycosyltransferase involved in cell wall biosynthesis